MQSVELRIELDEDTKDQLYQQMLTIANKAVEDATNNVTVNNRYLNQKQLMEYMQVGVQRIREWETMGLRFFMNGRTKVYDMKDIEMFFEELKI